MMARHDSFVSPELQKAAWSRDENRVYFVAEILTQTYVLDIIRSY